MELKFKNLLNTTWSHSRKVAVFVIGSIVVLIGIAMIVLPGPAIVVIPIGLLILATEFRWAKKWLIGFKRMIRYFKIKFRTFKQRFANRAVQPDVDTAP